MTNGPDVVVVGAARVPVGKFLGGLAGLTAPQLGAVAIRAALERSGVDPARIDEVFFGNVVSAGIGQAPARQAAIDAGLPPSIPATTVNKVCGSGLKAVMLAAQAIRAGDGTTYVVGGMESMSNAPYLLPQARAGYRLGHQQVLDANVHDGLWCSFVDQHMGMLAEHIAIVYDVSREEQDRFALDSHRKAIAAQEGGAFVDEIAPVDVPQRKGAVVRIDVDETPRRDTSLEALAKLRPAFCPDGCVTAGNAPGLSDGAAALVVMERRAAEKAGYPILARVLGSANAARDPKLIFAAPPLAVRAVLERTGLTLDDVDLLEVNEAFAAQILANEKELGWDRDRLNVNGGAIALGHPLGASGARVLVTLLHALRRRRLKRGLAALCLGGGGALAMAIEVA
ncbi:MAG TPA: acetyl-CoA C-acetyltransferase [Chloroflexota bacterium]|nr:acetyl-CoA C-acetyltransferase [Chloroflexota bacterium]